VAPLSQPHTVPCRRGVCPVKAASIPQVSVVIRRSLCFVPVVLGFSSIIDEFV